jgi:AraC-like DNA-binding protein
VAQIVETSDPELASEIFREQYASMRMRVQGSQPLLRLASTQVGQARLDRTTFRMALEGSADPLGAIAILHVLSGTVRYSSGDSEETYGPGDISFPIPLGRSWSTRLQDVDSEVIMLDPVLLDQIAAREPGARLPVRLLSNRPHSELAAAQLWQRSEGIRAIVAQPEAVQPLVINAAAQMLAACVLAAFPNTALTDPTIEDRHDAHPDTVRRAVTFIDENAHNDITIADIAAAAFVTIRAVQLAFRRHLDTTPMAYLRRVRLAHAHQDLLAGDPAHESVTAVAYRWGFPNPARFAALYRQAYGTLPSHTLRQD